MAIDTNIPEAWLLPLFWAVVDGSQAGNLRQNQPALLVGHPLALGTAVANVPIAVGSLAQAKILFGEGSMLERMVAKFKANNTTQELWCIPVPQPSAGVAATGSISIAVSGLQSGVLSTYIAGYLVAITVYTTDTAAAIATRLAGAINALGLLPVVAAVDGTTTSKVNLTAKWQGLSGNDISIGFNQLGLNGGEMYPGGLTTTVVAMANGAGNPDFTAAIAAIQAKQFLHVGMPLADTGSLQIWDAEYGFGAGGRWSFTRQQYGWIYNYRRDTYANLMAWGPLHNSCVISTMALEKAAPTPVWEWTAAYCGQASAALLADAARPLQSLELAGCAPAPIQSLFAQDELNSLTNNGLAIQGIAPSGNAMILREALQYQFNQFGQGDTAFGLVTILSNLAALLARMKSAITSKYPRSKLAPDGTRFGPGQSIVTPSIARAELVAEARRAEYDGLMSNIAAFKANLLVEIDDNNPNRLNVLWPPQLMGQLRQFAVLAQFRLQYDNLAA